MAPEAFRAPHANADASRKTRVFRRLSPLVVAFVACSALAAPKGARHGRPQFAKLSVSQVAAPAAGAPASTDLSVYPDTAPAPGAERSILSGPSPEGVESDAARLESVGGRARVDIVVPESLLRFADVAPVGELTLERAILGAYGFSRDIRMAEARRNQAVYQSDQARGLLLPSLTLRDGRGRETSSPGSVIDQTTGSARIRDEHLRKDNIVTLKQPLLDAPSLLDWRRREIIADSRQNALVSARGDAFVATIQAYLNIVTTRLLSDLYTEYEQQLDGLLDYVSKRAEAGAASQSDRERVRARALAAQSARLEQQAAQTAAVVEFVRLTNLAPRSVLLPRREEAGPDVPDSYDNGIALALEASPDIRLLKAELEAAEKDIAASRARALPRFDIELSDSKVTNAGGPIGLQHDQRAMVVMTWNVLNGSSDYFNLREKQEKRIESFYKLDDQQRRLRQSLSAQYATLDATKSRIAAGYKEWRATYSAARSMSYRMLSGNQSLLDLLDALDRVQQARARLIGLHAAEIIAVAQISRLAGTFPDVAQLADAAPSRGSPQTRQ